jgi:hypothetical protein
MSNPRQKWPAVWTHGLPIFAVIISLFFRLRRVPQANDLIWSSGEPASFTASVNISRVLPENRKTGAAGRTVLWLQNCVAGYRRFHK